MLAIILILLIFEPLINSLINFSYLDELIVLLLICYCTLNLIIYKKKCLSSSEKKIFVLVIIYYLVGAVATLIYNYQNNIMYSFVSGFFSIKSFIAFLGFIILLRTKKVNLVQTLDILYIVANISLTFVFAVGFLNNFFHFYELGEHRFGIATSALFFGHNTYLAFFTVLCFLICFFHLIYIGKINRVLLVYYYISTVWVLLVAGRMKAIGFIILFTLVFLLLLILKRVNKKTNKVKLRYFIVPLIIVGAIGFSYFQFYFLNDEQSRNIMLVTSFKIAKDHFPLGAGFGTFGTEFSRNRYSLLYFIYGINDVYGLTPDYPHFITDSSYPAVIGETGFIGLIIFMLILISVIRYIIKSKSDKIVKYFSLLMLLYLLIESIADTIFMTSRACCMFALIVFYIEVAKTKNIRIKI